MSRFVCACYGKLLGSQAFGLSENPRGKSPHDCWRHGYPLLCTHPNLLHDPVLLNTEGLRPKATDVDLSNVFLVVQPSKIIFLT